MRWNSWQTLLSSSIIIEDWFACPVGGNEYQLYKVVSIFGGTPPLVYGTTCQAFDSLSALDYSGPSPAVDSYS